MSLSSSSADQFPLTFAVGCTRRFFLLSDDCRCASEEPHSANPAPPAEQRLWAGASTELAGLPSPSLQSRSSL